MKLQLLNILVLLLLIVACKKDGNTKTVDIYREWEVTGFMSVESVAYPKTEGNRIMLTFNSTGVYQVHLDINYCSGNFTVGKNCQLQIQSSGCSKACCDSKFSEKLIETLPKVTSYEIVGGQLKISVPQWGYIELQLAE
jgi:hypothetical protein